VALLGPNGAGKTTTVGLLLGLLSPGSGQVQVYGRPPSHAVAAGLVGAIGSRNELYRLYGRLTSRRAPG